MVQVAYAASKANGRKLQSNGDSSENHESLKMPSSAAFNRTMSFVAIFVVLMQVGYIVLFHAFDRGLTSYIGFRPATPETCKGQPNNAKCGRPDLFAFQTMSGLVFLFVGGWGLYLWHVAKSESVRRFTTPASRLYGYQTQAEWLTVVNLAYQLWDFAISLTIPEHCTAIMLTHHVVAATVSFSGVYNYMLGYYAAFFLGISEVSSIYLVSMDLSKYFEPLPGTWFDFYVLHWTKPLFAITFIYYRVILWWPVSKRLFDDVRAVTSSGQAEALRPGRTWILYLWLGLNLPMGILQLYWVTIILAKAYATLSGGD
jgi:TLC domain